LSYFLPGGFRFHTKYETGSEVVLSIGNFIFKKKKFLLRSIGSATQKIKTILRATLLPLLSSPSNAGRYLPSNQSGRKYPSCQVLFLNNTLFLFFFINIDYCLFLLKNKRRKNKEIEG
jgi:hypothetical protein